MMLEQARHCDSFLKHHAISCRGSADHGRRTMVIHCKNVCDCVETEKVVCGDENVDVGNGWKWNTEPSIKAIVTTLIAVENVTSPYVLGAGLYPSYAL